MFNIIFGAGAASRYGSGSATLIEMVINVIGKVKKC
jgi:hypothetical protein